MSMCTYKGCSHPQHYGDKCIFHADRKDAREFRNALARQIRQWRREKAESWDFRGWVFVDVQRSRVWGQSRNLFTRATFPVRAVFTGAKFADDAAFRMAAFSAEAWFEGVVFSGDVWFDHATFSDLTVFLGAEFSGLAWFDRATFSRETGFQGSRFVGDVSFSGAKFSGHARFGLATFFGAVEFGSAVFAQGASFGEATFSREVRFRGTTFSSEMDMSYASFAILGDFTCAVIVGRVKLTWPGEGHKQAEKGQEVNRGRLLLKGLEFAKTEGGEEPLLDLRGNRLQEDCKLAIHDTNMSDVLLEGTDCRLIEFRHAQWRMSKEKRHTARRTVADEHYLRTDPKKYGADLLSWDRVAVTYQQLVDRYRRDLDHPVANDFERGIFEARLESAKAKGLWRYRLLLGAYKFASDFSGSIARPVVWIIVLTALCAVVYGFGLYHQGFHLPWKAGWSTVWESVVASLRAVSLNRAWFSTEVDSNAASHFCRLILTLVSLAQVLLTATLATLFIFSVRRRFKHTE